MGPGLNLETPEEIDAPIETQNSNAPEEHQRRLMLEIRVDFGILM
jgi:hypothetical protein